MAKQKKTAVKPKTPFRDRRKLQQRIVFGILAAVLGAGLIISSIVWIPGMGGVPDSTPQVKPPLTAAELEEKAKADPDNVGVLVELAQACQREGNVQKAVETYEKAVSLEPGRDDLKDLLAGSYVSAGRYDQAVKILEEVISRNPGDKEAHYYYGHALAARREYGRAVEEFERYIALAGENSPEAENVRRIVETLKPLAEKQQ